MREILYLLLFYICFVGFYATLNIKFELMTWDTFIHQMIIFAFGGTLSYLLQVFRKRNQQKKTSHS